jgi:solute carrier family 8 (sodium/calcium exchanger)
MGVIYLLILFYFFLGIAIVSDLFMEAIEVITSKKTVISVEDPNQPGKMIDVERNVWNPTIANLTLMALGSSMPEILLSVFSTVLDLDGIPSTLGPAAIVGSAAFNLFVISAVSIASVGLEPKKIFDVRVFMWTAVASTWAYVWFFLVLTVISPNYVELWEAIVTFLQFVMLCLVAYGCDKWTGSKVLQAETSEKLKKDAAKHSLRKVADSIGILYVVEMGMDRLPQGCKVAQKETI